MYINTNMDSPWGGTGTGQEIIDPPSTRGRPKSAIGKLGGNYPPTNNPPTNSSSESRANQEILAQAEVESVDQSKVHQHIHFNRSMGVDPFVHSHVHINRPHTQGSFYPQATYREAPMGQGAPLGFPPLDHATHAASQGQGQGQGQRSNYAFNMGNTGGQGQGQTWGVGPGVTFLDSGQNSLEAHAERRHGYGHGQGKERERPRSQGSKQQGGQQGQGPQSLFSSTPTGKNHPNPSTDATRSAGGTGTHRERRPKKNEQTEFTHIPKVHRTDVLQSQTQPKKKKPLISAPELLALAETDPGFFSRHQTPINTNINTNTMGMGRVASPSSSKHKHGDRDRDTDRNDVELAFIQAAHATYSPGNSPQRPQSPEERELAIMSGIGPTKGKTVLSIKRGAIATEIALAEVNKMKETRSDRERQKRLKTEKKEKTLKQRQAEIAHARDMLEADKERQLEAIEVEKRRLEQAQAHLLESQDKKVAQALRKKEQKHKKQVHEMGQSLKRERMEMERKHTQTLQEELDALKKKEAEQVELVRLESHEKERALEAQRNALANLLKTPFRIGLSVEVWTPAEPHHPIHDSCDTCENSRHIATKEGLDDILRERHEHEYVNM